MCIGAANIKPVPGADWLYHPDVVTTIEGLGLALGHTGGRVAGLQQQAVRLTAGGAHISQIDPQHSVHCTDVERVA